MVVGIQRGNSRKIFTTFRDEREELEKLLPKFMRTWKGACPIGELVMLGFRNYPRCGSGARKEWRRFQPFFSSLISS